jgi:hypothetical protein
VVGTSVIEELHLLLLHTEYNIMNIARGELQQDVQPKHQNII